MPTPGTLEALDRFWASYLGCRREDLHSPRTLVVTHAGPLSDYRGLFAFRRGAACVVSAPADLVDTVSRAAGCRPSAEIFDGAFLRTILQGMVDRVIGPAWYGYADEADFLLSAPRGARLLTKRDEPALCGLAEACIQADWEHSTIEVGRPPIFGCLLDDILVAAACFTIWEADTVRLAHVGVLTHPLYRSKGYGRAVVSAITDHALRLGLLPQDRTLRANAPAMAVAKALGYQAYAASIAVRLA